MKKLLSIILALSIAGTFPILGSAAVGGPVQGNENLKQAQEAATFFTQQELNNKSFDNRSYGNIIGRIALQGDKELNPEDFYDYAQQYFNFSLQETFRRGDLVVVQRNDNTYRYGLIMGYLGNDQYRVQVSQEGRLTEDIETPYIGKINRLIFDQVIQVPGKQHIAQQLAISGAHDAGNAGISAAGEVVCSRENMNAQADAQKLFTPQELGNMIVYYPYSFMSHYLGIVYPDERNRMDAIWNKRFKIYFGALGYSFSPEHTFRRGERVIAPNSTNANLYAPNVPMLDKYSYAQAIVLGYDATRKTYIVQWEEGTKQVVEVFKAEDLGKYRKHLLDARSHIKNQALFTQNELNVLPVPYLASDVINEIAVRAKMRSLGTGSGSIPEAFNDEKARKRFNFDPHNSFKRGELVVVPRSDLHYRYALVLGCLGSGNYRVQVTAQGNIKDFPASSIGKLKLNFELLDRTPEIKLETERALLEGTNAQAPEVLKTILQMMSDDALQEGTPIAKIKDAIRDNGMKKLEEALGANNQSLEVIDENGYTPLLFAVYSHNPAAVSLLLKKGANAYKKAMIQHTKEKDEKSELDAFSLAKALGENNHNYDEIIAILETYKAENDPAEQTKKRKEKAIDQVESLIRRNERMGGRDFDKEFQERLKVLRKELSPAQQARLDLLTKDIHLVNHETTKAYWHALAVLLFKLPEFKGDVPMAAPAAKTDQPSIGGIDI